MIPLNVAPPASHLAPRSAIPSRSRTERFLMPQPSLRSIAVFCGSRPGNDPAYHAACVALGAGLARAGMRLVYGGGRVGLMGAVADGAL